ncbi:MAG: SRPBCC family protein [Paludibaculum sp.]
MDERKESDATPTRNRTEVERKSELELVVTRTINAPARLVFEAWTQAELFRRWWVPKSYGLNLLSCDMDVRVGGEYRLVFRHEDSTMEFFGTYLEVTPHSRLVWTNEEGDGGNTITTVTFEEIAGRTSLVVHDRYPSKEALDSGSAGALPETLDQLDELLAGLGSSTETARTGKE